MLKRITAVLLCSVMALTLMAGPGGRSGGGSFSSGGSRSSGPSRSYSSPSRPSSPSPSRSASPSSPSRGGSFSTPSAPRQVTRPTQSSMARVQQQTAMSTQAKASLSKFKAPAAPAPAVASVKSSPVYAKSFSSTAPRTTYRGYLGNRQTYYSGYNPPVYVYSYAPRYGMMDAMFMWMMLDNMNHNQYYHHRNDADSQNWRRDADKQAATDAELRAKLATMDAKVKELEKAKTPVDPAYMTPGVDPLVAMPIEVAEATLPQETIQNETVTQTEGDGFDDDSMAGIIFLWFLGISALIVAGFGLFTWSQNRKRRNNFSSRYRL